MEYSKIASMQVKNFRSVGDITIKFDESPIIALVGDNESGKTSLVKAFVVGGMNGLASKQKAYIKDGTKGFGVQIRLEDDTCITRIKTSASNTLTIERPGQEPWQATKIDRGYGTPAELQAVMGLVEEPETKEYLQVRTYEDQLLFVITSGSTNYKVMYDALKVDQLTKAIKLGNEEANTLRRQLDRNSMLIEEYTYSMRQLRIVDISAAKAIRERIQKQMAVLNKMEQAVRLNRELQSLEEQHELIGLLKELKGIDEETVKTFDRTISLYRDTLRDEKEQELLLKVVELEQISTGSLEKMERALSLEKETERIKSSSKVYGDLDKVSEIDIQTMSMLDNLERALNYKSNIEENERVLKVYGSVQSAEEIKQDDLKVLDRIASIISLRDEVFKNHSELQVFAGEITRLTKQLEESGAVVADCPRCGETIVVDARV